MPDKCEKCKYFMRTKKYLPGIGDNIPRKKLPLDYIPQYKCRLSHEIAESAEGWVPFTRTYTCPDFKKA